MVTPPVNFKPQENSFQQLDKWGETLSYLRIHTIIYNFSKLF